MIESDDNISVNLVDMKVEQYMTEDWSQAKHFIDNVCADYLARSAILQPTKISVDYRKSSRLYFDNKVEIDVNFDQLILISDFKDISIFFRYFKIYDIVIKPAISEVLEALSVFIE